MIRTERKKIKLQEESYLNWNLALNTKTMNQAETMQSPFIWAWPPSIHRKILFPIVLLALCTFRAKNIGTIKIKGQRKHHRLALSYSLGGMFNKKEASYFFLYFLNFPDATFQTHLRPSAVGDCYDFWVLICHPLPSPTPSQYFVLCLRWSCACFPPSHLPASWNWEMNASKGEWLCFWQLFRLSLEMEMFYYFVLEMKFLTRNIATAESISSFFDISIANTTTVSMNC